MTITQLLQSGPAKANELFTKLSDTSEGAVKTREKLLGELREELELQARLEEQHLFPVLRKHKETKDLVADAINDNRQVRALLAELDRMPKNEEGFASKVAELRKVFQQHVRDERKELLPAVRKALSDEEAQGIVEKFEAGRERAEDAKRDEAEQRREAARREREDEERREAARRDREEAAARRQRDREEAERAQAQEAHKAQRPTARDVDDAMTRPAEPVADARRRMVGNVEEVARTGAAAATAATQQTSWLADQAAQQTASSFSAAARAQADLARPVVGAMGALAGGPAVASDVAREATEAWVEWVGKTIETNTRASMEMARITSPVQLAEVQSRYLQDTLMAMMTVGERLGQIPMRAARHFSGVVRSTGETLRQPEKGGRFR